MASFAFITNSLMLIFLVITATTNFRASVKCLTITATLGALTCLFALISVIIFGVATDTYSYLDKFTGYGLDIFSNRGKWMPRPEYTFLSWSYICEVFCAIFSLISCKPGLKFFFWVKDTFIKLNFFLFYIGVIMYFESYFIRKAKILYEKQSLRSSVKSMQ